MIETYYAGCYWRNRSESAEQCARRAESLFQGLSACDPLFTRWFEQGKSFKEASKLAFEPSAEMFLKFFARKRYQFTPRCFHVGVWNGEDDDGIGVSFTCGVIGSQQPGNCVVTPPDLGASAERLQTGHSLSKLLRCMVSAWEPDWGVATSREHRDVVSKTRWVDAFPGGLMYFSHRLGTVPPLPEPVRVEQVEDKGTLVVLTPERFTARNPAHVELAARVGEQLEKAGLLRPLASSPSGPAHGG